MPHSLKYTNRTYLDLLSKRVIIFDGAMGTALQRQNLRPEHFGGEKWFGCNDYLALTFPQAIETVHRSNLEVGADVIETCTFRANRLTLKDYGLENSVYAINKSATSLARLLADEYSRGGKKRCVAGSIGPTGKLPSMNDPELSNIAFDELADIFREQTKGLIDGGSDLIIIETSQDILEVKATLIGILEAFAESGVTLPIHAQVTLDTNGRMLLGTDIGAVHSILHGFPIEAIGLNCSTGPDYMREPIRYLGENSPLPVSCIPNAGLPLNVDGVAVYPMEPQPFAEMLIEYVKKFGVNIVGGCCGTTAEHIHALVKGLGVYTQAARIFIPPASLASSVQSMTMKQEPAPFLIGERLNTQGSRKFKQLLLDEAYDSILSIAQQQVDSGAHGLDICVALTERSDEAEMMRKVIKTLSTVTRVPFIIDTTELEVMEIALQTAPGKCLINSTNLEGGLEKARRVLSLAKKYNAAVLCLTIDEKGMAKTAERKLEIARRIYELAVDEIGLEPSNIVFDALTFTLATGEAEFLNSSIETMEGIRLIKQAFPESLTSLGVSNVSFGLSPKVRACINSVMLYHAVQAGLDMAIVNPAQITPYAEIAAEERTLVEDLVYNRKENALQHLIGYFDSRSGEKDSATNGKDDHFTNLPIEQKIQWRILHRKIEGIEHELDEIVLAADPDARSQTAVQVLNTILLPAMKEVGDKFGAGELILPFVLQSAEVMKKAVSHLETYLEKKEGTSKGLLVLATVYGDVHDIGKNLVKTILSNNGYTVVDLGKQTPAETIIAKAVELSADAIGLSALLVSTSKQMPLIVNELDRRNIKIPVLIGGAAINRRFSRRILKTETGKYYEPGVFYCKDAFEGLSTMDSLSEPSSRQQLVDRIRQESEDELGREVRARSSVAVPGKHSEIGAAPHIPVPPRWGTHVVKSFPLDMVFKHLPKNELFRLSWGGKNTHGDAWVKLLAEFEGRLEKMRLEQIKDPWLNPQGVYGYWPAQSEGEDLILFDPDSLNGSQPREITRFSFPRQKDGEFLCLADYFLPVSTKKMDIVALQVVTVGNAASERFERLQEGNNYSEAYFAHGLAVQMAEATADYLHQHICKELGIPPGQGKRYSWGYPSIPELADHQKVFQLLPAEQALGMTLTTAFQLVPEQSTAAIILHHPEAKYYTVGENRLELLIK